MDTNKLIKFSEQIATDLINVANRNGLHPQELIIALVMTERILQNVIFQNQNDARAAVLEGHATFNAISQPPPMEH